MAGSGANLVPLGQPGPPPPAVVAAPPPVMAVEEMDEGPASKRARGEDSLIPEQEFLARNPPQVWIHLASLKLQKVTQLYWLMI